MCPPRWESLDSIFLQDALAEMRVQDAEKIRSLERQARFLTASGKPTGERLQLLLHQVSIYSNHIHSSSLRAARDLTKTLAFISPDIPLDPEDIEDFVVAVRHSLGEIKDELAYVTLEADRLKALARFAPNLDVEVDRAEIKDDILRFMQEYIEVIVGGSGERPSVTLEEEGEVSMSATKPATMLA